MLGHVTDGVAHIFYDIFSALDKTSVGQDVVVLGVFEYLSHYVHKLLS